MTTKPSNGEKVRAKIHSLAEPAPTRNSQPLPATGRAGRNLPAAIGVGVTLGAVVIAILAFFPDAFTLVVAALVIVGLYELAGAFARTGARIALPPLWVGGLGMLATAHFSGLEPMLFAFYLTIAAVVAWRLVDGSAGALQDCAASVLAVAWVPLMASFAVLLQQAGRGVAPVITFILCAIGNDIGGYAAGVLFGKHPMAPQVSPKKSWEGFAGSVALATLAAVICMWYLGGAWWWGLLLGVTSAIAATAGDLAESLVKRDVGLKDMSQILPGHGGVMDRADSLVVVAPVTYFVLYLALGW